MRSSGSALAQQKQTSVTVRTLPTPEGGVILDFHVMQVLKGIVAKKKKISGDHQIISNFKMNPCIKYIYNIDTVSIILTVGLQGETRYSCLSVSLCF